jgi:segregation and condensation protein B
LDHPRTAQLLAAMPLRRQTLTGTSLKSVIESLLFVVDHPLTLDKLCSILEEYERKVIAAAIDELLEDYRQGSRGIYLAEVAGGWQLRSRPENADYLRRLSRSRSYRFSQSSMETLAIVAYRQPITRAEVEYLRGVDSGGVLKTLLEKKLIRILGKKDIPGRPLIYGTSREFLETFNLKDLASLPTLKEVQELTGRDLLEKQEELPLSD